jgi:hypothetical protein
VVLTRKFQYLNWTRSKIAFFNEVKMTRFLCFVILVCSISQPSAAQNVSQQRIEAWQNRTGTARKCVNDIDIYDEQTACGANWQNNCLSPVVCSEAGTIRIRKSGEDFALATAGSCHGRDRQQILNAYRPDCYLFGTAAAPNEPPVSEPYKTKPNGITCGNGDGWFSANGNCYSTYEQALRSNKGLNPYGH